MSDVIHIWYVYVLFRENGIPFYVGYGKGNRWLHHERWAIKGDTSFKSRVIRKTLRACGEVPKVKVAEDLTAAEAKALEIALIAAIGRRPDGPLVNLTRGGDGIVDSSEAVRRKISRANKGRAVSAEVRQRLSQFHRGRPNPHQYKTAEKIRGKKRTAASKAKMRAAKVGKKTWNTGLRLTEKHKQNLRGPRGPQPKMRGPRGHWYHTPEGIPYVSFEPRSPNDKPGRWPNGSPLKGRTLSEERKKKLRVPKGPRTPRALDASRELRRTIESAIPLRVPLLVGEKVGSSWGDVKERPGWASAQLSSDALGYRG